LNIDGIETLTTKETPKEEIIHETHEQYFTDAELPGLIKHMYHRT
jgi:hypothetical protein